MTSLSEMMARLPEEERRKIEERTQELLAEELTRRALRKARQQAKAHLEKELGVRWDDVLRIEERSDLLLTAMIGCVEAMGGKLSLVAAFPGRPPVALKCTGDLDEGEFEPLPHEAVSNSQEGPAENPDTFDTADERSPSITD